MKRISYLLFLSFTFFLANVHGQVAVNTTGTNANSSAMLDVESTTKGMLIPRMTTAQRTAISAPAAGLLVYDNTTASFWFHNGTAWVELISGGTGWKLTGNSGTDTSINFVGTLDNKDLKFRIANTRTGTLATNGNVFWGLNSGVATTGILNNAIGAYSLYTNGLGTSNNALGTNALFSNTSGSANQAMGSQALYNNTSADLNIAIGHQSLFSNTTGNSNIAVGPYALGGNLTAYSNIAIGNSALGTNTNRSNLVAIGDSALYRNGFGATDVLEAISNVAVGSKAMYNNTKGGYNTALGTRSLYANTIGFQNIAVGSEALAFNNIGQRNIAIGFRTLLSNTGGGENVAIGDVAMLNNTTGGNNTAVGSSTLYSNTIGIGNTALGDRGLFSNTQGVSNVAAGSGALYQNTTGYENVGVGVNAIYNNTVGFRNTGLGDFAEVSSNNLQNATAIGNRSYVSASNSLVLGSIAGVNNASDNVNVGIGTSAPTGRLHIRHDSYPVPTILLEETADDYTRMQFRNTNANSFWEFNAIPKTLNTSAKIEFWNSSNGTVTTPLILFGNGNATLLGTLTQSSDARLKKDIKPIPNAVSALSRLNGYSYYWKEESRDASCQMGVLAQEVQQVFPSLVKEDSNGILSVNYSGLIPVLIEAIKEQQKQINELKKLLTK